MENKVYIVNLGKYNEGELVGAWFTLPVDESEVAEKIGLNSKYEEYAVHDYELPVEIEEYVSLEELNKMDSMLEEINEIVDERHILPLCNYFGSLEELDENIDNVNFFDADSMSDIAMEYVEDGAFGEVPERLIDYIDYEAIGRDLEINGTFIEVGGGYYEINR